MTDELARNLRVQADVVLEALGLLRHTNVEKYRQRIMKSFTYAVAHMKKKREDVYDARDSKLLRYALVVRDANNWEQYIALLEKHFPNRTPRIIAYEFARMFQTMFNNNIKFHFTFKFDKEAMKPKKVIKTDLDAALDLLSDLKEYIGKVEEDLMNYVKTVENRVSNEVAVINNEFSAVREDMDTLAHMASDHKHDQKGEAYIAIPARLIRGGMKYGKAKE